MRKKIRVSVWVFVVILVMCASIVFAQTGGWVYKPAINNTGEIGDATHTWQRGYFQKVYPGNSGSFIQTVSRTLTAAELLALFTTAIEVVPAPGTHFIIEILGCDLYYKYGGTAYTIGSATNLALKYVDKNGTAATGTQAVTNLIDQTANTTAKLLPIAVAAGAATLRENKNVTLTLAGANPTLGNGTLTVKVTYVVHPTGF